MDSHALAELADARGIEREFLDYKKDPVSIPLESRARILRLMGYEGGSQHAAETLKGIHDAAWSEILPPCVVATEQDDLIIPVHLPASVFSGGLRLRVRDGQENVQSFELLDEARSATVSHSHDGNPLEFRSFRLMGVLPRGYFDADLIDGHGQVHGHTRICITPRHAYRPEILDEGQRLFGISVQLYAVRSERNWGMGDFTDLKSLIRDAAAQGIHTVGVNPLHALFPANPYHFSPYSPSNRAFLNVMYIDPMAIPEYANCDAARELVESDAFQGELTRLRDTHLVDYAGVAASKMKILELLYRDFISAGTGNLGSRHEAFRDFLEAGGTALRDHARYDALHAHFLAQDSNCWGWPVWPEEYRQSESDAVELFAENHGDRVLFYCYLQWCAREQLLAAQNLSEELGMHVGIYLDLAVGVDLNGSEVWANKESFALNASAGAPPDELARAGQDWGFPPLCPRELDRTAYELFIRNLRANMALCGAVRYDHAVSLLRLWWIPKDATAAEGAYVRYPLDTLLGLIALESQNQRCMVIGEDLGTVPKELTESMEARHVLSYRVLYFEKSDEAMTSPDAYPAEAAATITTHDLPTLASWWDGSDIDLRSKLGLLGTEAVAEQMREERELDRQKLLDALAESNSWSGGLESLSMPSMTTELSVAVHRFLAKSHAALLLTQLEDLMGMLTPVNVPGTFQEHANWQRKLRHPVEGLFERDDAAAICAALREERAP